MSNKFFRQPANDGDRRRYERVPIKALAVADSRTQENVGALLNLSFGGMLVESEKRFKPEDSSQFRIMLDESFLGSNFFEFDVECVWCEDNPSGGYQTGFVFLPSSGNHIIAIDQINSRFRRSTAVVS
jgi:hypothetical protein